MPVIENQTKWRLSDLTKYRRVNVSLQRGRVTICNDQSPPRSSGRRDLIGRERSESQLPEFRSDMMSVIDRYYWYITNKWHFHYDSTRQRCRNAYQVEIGLYFTFWEGEGKQFKGLWCLDLIWWNRSYVFNRITRTLWLCERTGTIRGLDELILFIEFG